MSLRMERGKDVENYYEERIPDCSTCIRKKTCENYEENTYCTRWQSREPEARLPDPNEQWKRGEDDPF